MTDPIIKSEWEILDRPHNPAMDAILGVPSPALDHGFVRVIDYMGDEAAVCQAARVSYGKGTKTLSDDVGLLRYLMRHRHSTPFEMCELKLHVKLPIFVARQWIRHRTANVNEYSARYSIMPGEFYIPKAENISVQSKDNKQGRAEPLLAHEASAVQDQFSAVNDFAYGIYESMHEDYDVARELARINLPGSVYTEWYWKVDLHNLLHFLSLRADPHAQYEIRVYADIICNVVEEWVPNIWKAFKDYRMDAHTFSGPEMDALRAIIAKADPNVFGGSVHQHMTTGKRASKREREAFYKALGAEL